MCRSEYDLTCRSRQRARRRARQRGNYHRLGVDVLRLHRLDLRYGEVRDATPDVIAALSEIIGFADPEGMWCLAPWRRDGDPDHDAVGRAAEIVCHAYQVRLVRYLVCAWTRRHPDDIAWGQARLVRLAGPLVARKASALPPDIRAAAEHPAARSCT